MADNQKVLRILGIRGLPAAHGGFETFAEHLALFLVAKGWKVVVYCQATDYDKLTFDEWSGVTRVHIPSKSDGSVDSVFFDLRSTLHAARSGGLCLTLGYNTAIFSVLLRLASVRNVINMDGIEWARAKWGALAKSWFWLNERFGCWLGDHLIADHPEIKRHLATRVRSSKIEMIPYGSELIQGGDVSVLEQFNISPHRFLTLIARPEPENSIYEIVSGFSARSRGIKLVVLGNYSEDDPYHRSVRSIASDEVLFLGAIYDKSVVHALRFFSLAYVHGHQVGGTNPSLVEAMGAGNAVIAHDNPFNRWVAGNSAFFFNGGKSFDALITSLLQDDSSLQQCRGEIAKRHSENFTWSAILERYDAMLRRQYELM